jgi:nitrogenase molybdenum-iron protein beta chain
MVAGMVNGFSERNDTAGSKINVIPGWVEPSDMRELKRILNILKVPFIMFPDTSDVLDAPQTGKHVFYPKGGVTVHALKQTGSSRHTLALGKMCSEPGALALESKCSVPLELTDIPVGLGATDRFLMSISRITGREITDELADERGRLIDIITDMHQYLDGKKVAVFGDPDILIPLVEFLSDMDMKPVHIISGTPGKYFTKRVRQILDNNGVTNANIQNGNVSDMFLLHQWIKNDPVDLIIGNTYGKYIARDEDIPFVRLGFPIYDRVGHSYFPTVGYTGGMRILEKILGVIMDRLDRDTPEEGFELVM